MEMGWETARVSIQMEMGARWMAQMAQMGTARAGRDGEGSSRAA